MPEGVTFVYAHEALRKLSSGAAGDEDPPNPRAYRRLSASEQEEREFALQPVLHQVTETLERSQRLYAQGCEVAAIGLLKYADLLLAQFNLALARANAGESGWQDALDDSVRDAEVEAWVAAQLTHAE